MTAGQLATALLNAYEVAAVDEGALHRALELLLHEEFDTVNSALATVARQNPDAVAHIGAVQALTLRTLWERGAARACP
jgi:hypothetical protein